MAVRLLLVLAMFAVLYGCGEASSPVTTINEPTTPRTAPLIPERTTPSSDTSARASASAGRSGEAQVEHSEADCRIATYVAQENMNRHEADAFSELLADMVRTMESPSWTAGSLRNTALDHLGVPRYPECKVGGE